MMCLRSSGTGIPTPPKSQPVSPPSHQPIKTISFSNDFHVKLNKLNNRKLASLYESICRVSLIKDPILAYVGVWVLLEALAVELGKKNTTAFVDFYNGKINTYYSSQRRQAKTIREVLKDIHGKGNANKHESRWYTVDAQQLNVDVETITPFLLQCIEEKLIERS